jgi:hypothetical protein
MATNHLRSFLYSFIFCLSNHRTFLLPLPVAMEYPSVIYFPPSPLFLFFFLLSPCHWSLSLALLLITTKLSQCSLLLLLLLLLLSAKGLVLAASYLNTALLLRSHASPLQSLAGIPPHLESLASGKLYTSPTTSPPSSGSGSSRLGQSGTYRPPSRKARSRRRSRSSCTLRIPRAPTSGSSPSFPEALDLGTKPIHNG